MVGVCLHEASECQMLRRGGGGVRGQGGREGQGGGRVRGQGGREGQGGGLG